MRFDLFSISFRFVSLVVLMFNLFLPFPFLFLLVLTVLRAFSKFNLTPLSVGCGSRLEFRFFRFLTIINDDDPAGKKR